MAQRRITPYPLALDGYNAAMKMKRLARIGRGALNDIEWSPDGKFFAVSTGIGVYLYDANLFEEVGFLDVNDNVTHIAFADDSKSLAIAKHNQIEVWEIQSRRKTSELDGEIQGGVWKLVYGRGGYIAAIGQLAQGVGESIPQLKVWQASTGRLIYFDNQAFGWTVAVDINPDGKTIAFMGSDGMAVRDILSGVKREVIDGDFDAAFNSDGTVLFSTSWDWMNTGTNYMVWMTNLSNGESSQILKGTECQYLSQNGNAIICYGKKDVILFDNKSGAILKTIKLQSDGTKDATVSPDGRYLALMEHDFIKIYDTQSEHEVKVMDFNPFDCLAVGMILIDENDYYAAATIDGNGKIRIIDLASGNTLRQFQESVNSIKGLAFSPDRLSVASIDTNSIVRLWRLQDGAITNEFNLDSYKADGPLVYSTDGLKIAMTNVIQEDTLELDLQTSDIRKIRGNPSPYRYAGILSYGWYFYSLDSHLITWDHDIANLILNDLTSNEIMTLHHEVKSGNSYPDAVALSSDGENLALGQASGEIIVWNLPKQQQIQTLLGHEPKFADGWAGAIIHLFFDPKNEVLVSVGWDGTTRLWNTHTGLQLQNINVCCFAEYSPDGRLLVTASHGVIYVWGTPPWP
jgi:WD40 repeat protein